MLDSFAPGGRVLVTGANGWFGRSALSVLREYDVEIYATSNRTTNLTLEGSEFAVRVWDENSINTFRPTAVIDCAFLTKDHLSDYAEEDYFATNRLLISRAKWLANLPSVKQFVGFSSGARLTDPTGPYGKLKAEYELEIEASARRNPELAAVIARAWSVSGRLVTKPSVFAFSDFILQAETGVIRVNSEGLVNRRYVSIDDLLLVSSALAREPGFQILDSGGELVELGQLAQMVIETLNPKAELQRQLRPGYPENNYYSDNSNWLTACEKLGYLPSSIYIQIQDVAEMLLSSR
jgi:nucleoside-diphosphate-sugar epimerase